MPAVLFWIIVGLDCGVSLRSVVKRRALDCGLSRACEYQDTLILRTKMTFETVKGSLEFFFSLSQSSKLVSQKWAMIPYLLA